VQLCEPARVDLPEDGPVSVCICYREQVVPSDRRVEELAAIEVCSGSADCVPLATAVLVDGEWSVDSIAQTLPSVASLSAAVCALTERVRALEERLGAS
jgi:hypothetical protein